MEPVATRTETETVELKKSLAELKQGLMSLVAMLNKHGRAELWFGIAPDGKVIGLDANEKTLRDVSQAISAHVEPAIYPQVSCQVVEGKSCLKIVVEGWQQPYFAHGRAYMRVADEDRKLSASELKSLILQKNRDALRWENEPSGLTLDQLVPGKIDRFLDMANLPEDNAANALEKLDLLRQGKPVNAASLFFGHAPAQLRCAVFATQTSSTIIDRHDFEGDVLELLQEAEKYILKNIHIGMRLEGMRRVDVPEIPLKAIREALVNAFCHRDWRDPDHVQVAIFRDRLEIRSPGRLYDNLTLDEVRRGNVSRRRNPKIAELLRRVHLVEAWGRGVPLILENAPATDFVEIGGLFITRFARPGTSVQAPGLAGQLVQEQQDPSGNATRILDHARRTPGNTRKRQEDAKKTPRKHQEKTKKTPGKHQEDAKKYHEAGTDKSARTSAQLRDKLLVLLQQQAESSVRVLAQTLGISQDSARHHLRQLQKGGRIRRVGPDRGGHWEVIEDGHKAGQ